MGKKVTETDQRASLQKMRDNFKGREGNGMPVDDQCYLRYLKARNYDFKKASEMLENTLKWRESFGVKALYDGSCSWDNVIQKENVTGKCTII